MPMKVFIPSYGRPHVPTLDRPSMQGGPFKPVVLVHNDEEAARYLPSVTERGGIVMVTNTPTGICGKSRQIQWALEHCANPDEWVAFCDDDLLSITEIEPHKRPPMHGGSLGIDIANDPNSKERVRYWRSVMREVPAGVNLEVIWRMLIQEWAEPIGCRHVGFSINNNPGFNNHNITKPAIWIRGDMFLWKHDPAYPWSACYGVQAEDYWHTAAHVLLYGSVVRYNWLWPAGDKYVQGGHGTRDDRREQRHVDIARLEQDFPGFYAPKNSRSAEPGFDVRVAIRGEASVAHWRSTLGVRNTPLMPAPGHTGDITAVLERWGCAPKKAPTKAKQLPPKKGAPAAKMPPKKLPPKKKALPPKRPTAPDVACNQLPLVPDAGDPQLGRVYVFTKDYTTLSGKVPQGTRVRMEHDYGNGNVGVIMKNHRILLAPFALLEPEQK